MTTPNERTAAAEIAADAAVADQQVKSHYCKHCPKAFVSGKALGGHMSSAHGHVKKSDSSSKKMKPEQSSKTQANSLDSTNKYICPQCSKEFHSPKALHGHMRLHPKRDHRGMKPPMAETQIKNPKEKSSEPETNKDGSDLENLRVVPVEDLNPNLNGYVKGRRGRRGTKPHKVDSPDTYLAKKKMLLKGDFGGLRTILDEGDDSGYFRRVFGTLLDLPALEVEEKCDISENHGVENCGRTGNSSSDTSFDADEGCSRKSTEYDQTCMKNLEEGNQLDGDGIRGKKRPRENSNKNSSMLIEAAAIQGNASANLARRSC